MEKVIRVFHSFAEAEAADREERARMSPEGGAEIFFQLRERYDFHAATERLARVYRVLELEQS